MKSEAETLLELEKLLESLDPAARKRAAEWIASKYASKVEAEPQPPPTFIPYPVPTPPSPPTPFPQLWRYPDPITIYGATNQHRCAFDGLPPGAYGLVCNCPKCSVMLTVTTNAAVPMSLTSGYINITAGCAPPMQPMFSYDGATLSGPPMRSWS